MKRLNALCSLLLISACGANPNSSDLSNDAVPPMLPQTAGKTLVYECGDYDFIARTGPGELALWLHDRYLVLGQVRAASGAKYEGDGVVVWIKDEDALLEDNGTRLTGCRQNLRRVPWEDARRRGVDFRGTGNEPGWYLEVLEGERLLYVGAYGSQRLLFEQPLKNSDSDSVTYRAGQSPDEISVKTSEVACGDSMSGDRYPITVDVSVGGEHLRGCGMFLEQHWE